VGISTKRVECRHQVRIRTKRCWAPCCATKLISLRAKSQTLDVRYGSISRDNGRFASCPLYPKADMFSVELDVCFVPQAALATLDKHQLSHHPPEAAQHVEWNRPPTAMFSRSSLKRSTAASVCKTSTWMSFSDKTSHEGMLRSWDRARREVVPL